MQIQRLYFFLFFQLLIVQIGTTQLSSTHDSIRILLEKAVVENNRKDGIPYAEKALKLTLSEQNDSLELQSRITLFQLQYGSSKFTDARAQAIEIQNLYLAKQDSLNAMKYKTKVAITYLANGEYKQGIPVTQQCADWYWQKKDTLLAIKQEQNIALINARQGKTNVAIKKYLEILPFLVEKDTTAWANALFGLGKAYYNNEDYNLSQSYYQKGLRLCLQSKTESACISFLNGVANCLTQKLQYDSSFYYLRKIRNITKETGDVQRQAVALGNIGRGYIAQDSFERAKPYLEELYTLYQGESINDKNILYGLAKNLSQIHLQNDDCNEAKNLLDEAYTVAQENNDTLQLWRISFLLTKTNICLGNSSKAQQYLEEYNTLDKVLFDAEKEAISFQLGNAYLTEREQYEQEKEEVNRTVVKLRQEHIHIMIGIAILLILVITLGIIFFFRHIKRNEKIIQAAHEEKEQAIQSKEKLKKQILDTPTHWEEQTFIIQSYGYSYNLKYKEVLYIKSDKNNTLLFIQGQENPIIKKKTLKKWEEELPSALFIRVHNQYIINLGQIHLLQEKQLFLHQVETPINIGNTHQKKFKEALVKYYETI